jgi:diguanylate cyclase (GGDEF)-like protein
MEDLLEREFSRGRRYDTPLALLFIDCDNFKMVNDSYGHNCGDKLLQHIAYQMMEMTRKEDVVSRFGGDEFVIILPNQTSEEALMVMERFQVLLKKCPMKYGNIIIPVSISFGIASAEDSNVKNPASLLKKADKRLYDAKKQKCPGVLIKEHL